MPGVRGAVEYEFLLRAAGVRGVNFDRFQEKFDLGDTANNFRSVGQAAVKTFDRGEDELRFLRESLDRGRPTLASLRMAPTGGWHIIPARGHTESELFLLYIVATDGSKDIRAVKTWDSLRRTDDWGGRVVAYLDTDTPLTGDPLPGR